MSKYTKGPWIMHNLDLVTGNVYFIHCELDNRAIAYLGFNAIENHANALLIAAAPDLLEACEAMLNAFKNNPSEFLATGDIPAAEQMMIVAVQKATYHTHDDLVDGEPFGKVAEAPDGEKEGWND